MKKHNIKVRLCLVENNITQKALAGRLGLNPKTLSNRLIKEQPEQIQKWLCDVIQGDTEHITDIKAHFNYKTRQKTTGTNKRVTECLNANHMYKWQLAEILGITPNQISMWLHTERPEQIQEWLCDVIQGDHTNIDSIRQYFRKKSMAEYGFMRDNYANKICREVEVKELESDIEKQKERDEWLYDYTKGGRK